MSELIKATFGVDVSPLKRGLAEAETAAKASAAKVSSALNSVQATAEKIGRRPTFRPFGQQQFNDFAGRQGPRTARDFLPAPKGKYPTPSEDKDAGRGLSGIGLGRGLALFGVVHQLIQAFIQANEEAEKLSVTIAKLTAPSGASAFRSSSAIQSNLTGIIQQLDELNERTGRESSTEGGFIGNAAGWIKRKSRQLLTGKNDASDAGEKEQLRKQAIKDIEDLAEKQRDLNQSVESGSEREIALAKEKIAHQEKLGELAAIEAATGVHDRAARDQEDRRTENANKLLEDAADQRQRELRLADHAAILATSSLTADQQRVQILKEQVAAIDDQLAKSRLLSEEQKSSLATQRISAVNELYRVQYKNRFDGPALYTPEKGEAAKFATWVKMQHGRLEDGMTGPKAAGSGSQLGSTGVLDRIEKNTEGLGANK